jgi:hypothetical protein
MSPSVKSLTFAEARPGVIVLHPQGDKLTITRKEDDRIFLTRIDHQDLYDSSFYSSEFDAIGFTTL